MCVCVCLLVKTNNLSFSTAFRHVAKTGDIRDFVIIEESGIAKGIRRIIAITGEEARQACLDANEIESKWDQIVKLEGIEKEKGIKSFEVVSFFYHSTSPLLSFPSRNPVCSYCEHVD